MKALETECTDCFYGTGCWACLDLKFPTLTYIYDVNYDMKRLLGLIAKSEERDPQLEINPGFWAGLELTE